MTDDLFVLKQMKAGDESALEYFFKEYTDILFYRALGVVHDQLVAEDIVQEVFIRFWDGRGKLDITASVFAYLAQAVTNACLNHLESLAVRKRYADTFRKDFREEEVNEYDREELEELRLRLQVLVDTLPEKCREIFVLACVDGLKYREVAERLDVSVNTVKTQVKVAYQRLRSELNDRDRNMLFYVLLLNMFLWGK